MHRRHMYRPSILIAALPEIAAGDGLDVVGEVATAGVLSGGWSKTAGGAETYVSDYSSSMCSAPLLSLH